LPLVDLLLHSSASDESVNEDAFSLAKAIDAEERLDIVSRIPGRIKDDDAIGANKIRSNSASFCRNEKESKFKTSGKSDNLDAHLARVSSRSLKLSIKVVRLAAVTLPSIRK
jgi:hypothetical protein